LSPPPFGGLGATYDDHLRLTGKHVVDFLLVLIELFTLGVTAEAFSVAGPSVWNSLPEYLRDPAVGKDSFRKQLKTFLFATY